MKKKGKTPKDEETLDEKSVPNNPELWSRAKALAKQKFDVYPSAYANGWAQNGTNLKVELGVVNDLR